MATWTLTQEKAARIAADVALGKRIDGLAAKLAALEETVANLTAVTMGAPVAGPDSQTLQQRIDAASPGDQLNLTGLTYSAGATVDKALTILGATITSAANVAALVISASDVTVDRCTFNGPGGTVYNFNEVAVSAFGTAGTPLTGITIKGCLIRNFGYGGVRLRWLSGVVVRGNIIEDVVYNGIMNLSAIGGYIDGNTVRRVGYNGTHSSGNAYGIGNTYQSPGDALSADVIIIGNTVEDVPTWHALDTHGGQRISFLENIVRRSRRGVMLTTTGAGVSPEVKATDCIVRGNQFLTPISIPAGEQYAVVPVEAINAIVTYNTITGWGAGRDLHPGYVNPGLVYENNIVTP